LYLFGKSNFGKTYGVDKVLSGKPKSKKYMPLPGQYFFSNHLNSEVVIVFKEWYFKILS
jgi:hypothetical protein